MQLIRKSLKLAISIVIKKSRFELHPSWAVLNLAFSCVDEHVALLGATLDAVLKERKCVKCSCAGLSS